MEEGQAVSKGQVLAELDATDYRNAYDAAQAQADAAQASGQKAQDGLRSQELEQARIDFDRWQDEYTRMKFLYDHKSLAANDFKKIEAGYQAAQQRYDMARQGTREEDKEPPAGSFAPPRRRCTRRRSGWRTRGCGRRSRASSGCGGSTWETRLAPGFLSSRVLDLDPVKVRVAIPEAEIGKVQEGARATVTIPSLDGNGSSRAKWKRWAWRRTRPRAPTASRLSFPTRSDCCARGW